MKTWKKITIPVAAVALLVAWYAFRPERLVINRSVNEAMPNAPGSSSAQPVESGRFYSILHPTEGTATIYQTGDGTRVLRFTSFSTSNGPDVHARQRLGPGEIPCSVHMVQTIQREFRSRGAKTGSGIAKSLGHGYNPKNERA